MCDKIKNAPFFKRISPRTDSRRISLDQSSTKINDLVKPNRSVFEVPQLAEEMTRIQAKELSDTAKCHGELIDRSWKIYLRQWNQPIMRKIVAESLPDIVVSMWREEFIELPLPNNQVTAKRPESHYSNHMISTGDITRRIRSSPYSNNRDHISDHIQRAQKDEIQTLLKCTPGPPSFEAGGTNKRSITEQDLKTREGIYSNMYQNIGQKRHVNTPADEEAKIATCRLLKTVISRTPISSTAFLLALYLIHKYRILPRSEIGAPGSQFRMFLIGLLLAHKYSEDHPYSNRVWAQLSEIPVIHVNTMERDFLHRIDHRLGFKLIDFKAWVVALDRKFGWSQLSAERRRDYRTMPLPPTPHSPKHHHAKLSDSYILSATKRAHPTLIASENERSGNNSYQGGLIGIVKSVFTGRGSSTSESEKTSLSLTNQKDSDDSSNIIPAPRTSSRRQSNSLFRL